MNLAWHCWSGWRLAAAAVGPSKKSLLYVGTRTCMVLVQPRRLLLYLAGGEWASTPYAHGGDGSVGTRTVPLTGGDRRKICNRNTECAAATATADDGRPFTVSPNSQYYLSSTSSSLFLSLSSTHGTDAIRDHSNGAVPSVSFSMDTSVSLDQYQIKGRRERDMPFDGVH